MNKIGLHDVSEGQPWLLDFPGPYFVVSADRVVVARNSAAETISQEDKNFSFVSERILGQLDALMAGHRAAWSHDREFVVQVGRGAETRFFLPQFAKSDAGWTVFLSDVTGLCEAGQSAIKIFSMLGHEVKTPLTSIRMTLYLLLEEKLGPLNPDQRELIAAGREDCENMLSLVQQISEISSIESGGESLNRTLIDPSSLLAAPLANNRHWFETTGQHVVVHTPKEALPRIYIDVAKVERAAGELLRAAALNSARGENIFVSLSIENRSLRLGVSCMIAGTEATENTKIILGPFGFQRAHRSGDLGLAICRALIAVQGGRTGIEVKEGRRELFFELPLPS